MKRISSIFLLALVAFVGTGCLKDKDYDNNKYGIKDPNSSSVGVGFPEASKTINVNAIEVKNTPQVINLALVNLLSDAVADQDIQIKVEADPAIVQEYNADNNPDLLIMDGADYSVSGTTVTIPKGTRTGTITLTINDATTLNASGRYGFGFKIAAVTPSGVTIAQNLKRVLYAVSIKNQYHADYEISVDLTGHPTAAGHYDDEVEFTTVDANTVETGLGVAGIFAASSRLFIMINPDNSLTLSSNAAAVFPIGDNKYDPVTKTFYFDYGWGTRHNVGTAKRQ